MLRARPGGPEPDRSAADLRWAARDHLLPHRPHAELYRPARPLALPVVLCASDQLIARLPCGTERT